MFITIFPENVESLMLTKDGISFIDTFFPVGLTSAFDSQRNFVRSEEKKLFFAFHFQTDEILFLFDCYLV